VRQAKQVPKFVQNDALDICITWCWSYTPSEISIVEMERAWWRMRIPQRMIWPACFVLIGAGTGLPDRRYRLKGPGPPPVVAKDVGCFLHFLSSFP